MIIGIKECPFARLVAPFRKLQGAGGYIIYIEREGYLYIYRERGREGERERERERERSCPPFF